MTAEELCALLDREPFAPFRVRPASGDAYEVRNPGLAMVMKSRLVIAAPDSDRWTWFRSCTSPPSRSSATGAPASRPVGTSADRSVPPEPGTTPNLPSPEERAGF
jgi:hypothetical protein